MSYRRKVRRWWAGVLLGGLLGAACVGQTPAPTKAAPCADAKGADAKVAKPCVVPGPGLGHEPSVLEQFPFPGESKGTAAAPDAPDAPDAPAPNSPPVPAPAKAGDGMGKVKDQFPYPGEAVGDAEGSSSSSSSAGNAGSVPADAGGDSDAKPKLKDEGSEGSTPRTRRRLRPQAQKILSDDERVDEDLSVAEFYRKQGNMNGAYMRAKDALKLQPDYSDAHLAVAEAAEKLGKKEEAATEYKAYLKLDPAGEGAKAARKALEKLSE